MSRQGAGEMASVLTSCGFCGGYALDYFLARCSDLLESLSVSGHFVCLCPKSKQLLCFFYQTTYHISCCQTTLFSNVWTSLTIWEEWSSISLALILPHFPLQLWEEATGAGEQIHRGTGGADLRQPQRHRQLQRQTRQMCHPQRDGTPDPPDQRAGWVDAVVWNPKGYWELELDRCTASQMNCWEVCV